ncbi:hypothetical protein TNCV_4868551 [Trichonephila clavipes]|nr:hypothetical protein TNCV_4868551 [Trichonephila clavipes]
MRRPNDFQVCCITFKSREHADHTVRCILSASRNSTHDELYDFWYYPAFVRKKSPVVVAQKKLSFNMRRIGCSVSTNCLQDISVIICYGKPWMASSYPTLHMPCFLESIPESYNETYCHFNSIHYSSLCFPGSLSPDNTPSHGFQ